MFFYLILFCICSHFCCYTDYKISNVKSVTGIGQNFGKFGVKLWYGKGAWRPLGHMAGLLACGLALVFP
jgi:hypothetical protein